MPNYKYLIDSGLVVSDASNLRTVVESELKAVFGQDLVVTSDTPQGRLIDAEVLARRAVIEAMAMIANQINPNVSRGPFLDSLCSFLDLERRESTRSILNNVLLTGRPGTTITKGSIARDQAGRSWMLDGGVTLAKDGKATGTFLALEEGPVPCAAGDLTRVTSSIIGWETVKNPTAAILGLDEQSDAALRTLRDNTLALQGVSTPLAITSHLYGDPVYARSVVYRENVTNKTQVIDGITLSPNSLWTCVQGGDDEAVAKALLKVKTIGADWVGSVELKIRDDESGQPYKVRFDRPAGVDLRIEVTMVQGAFTGDLYTATTDAILAYADGSVEGFAGFIVKDEYVAPVMIASAIQGQLAGAGVYSVKIARGDDALTANPIPLELKEYGRIQRGNITVRVRT